MNKHLIGAVIIAISAAVAAPAFASSGYGPAAHYNPIAGAPASQRGQSEQTIHAEFASADTDANTARQSFGGVSETRSQSGIRVLPDDARSTYLHH
jgi:hypothetical protein